MISNLVLQTTIDGLKEITNAKLHVLDANGNLLATTEPRDRDFKDGVLIFMAQNTDRQKLGDTFYFKVYDEQQLAYVLAVADTENVWLIGEMAVFQLQSLLTAYKERFDKENFIKNLLMDNLLMVDVYAKAKKLCIEVEVPRAVFLVETCKDNDAAALDKVKMLFSDKSRDFITTVNERSIVIVKQLEGSEDYPALEKAARDISHVFGRSAAQMHIAYGTIIGDLREVSRSYKEAKMALDIGKIFYEEKNIVGYNTLGIGRLIYQLPLPLCKMFIQEIFGDKSPDDFDDETLATIFKFFENNLNVSETSRQLFIHRNTLVYRLDKLRRMTGLDLHSFEDAITFKIALMVVKYMNYMESQDF